MHLAFLKSICAFEVTNFVATYTNPLQQAHSCSVHM